MEDSLSQAKTFITVAICTRNRVRFLERAVRSVACQLTPDTELLIVDNASTDGTLDFCKQIASTNPRIRYIQQMELGLSAARNCALSCSQSKYVLFLDDDALAEPGWLASYLGFLLHPPDPNIVCVGGPVFPDFEVPPPRWLSAKCGLLDYGKPERQLEAEAGPWGGNIAYERQAALDAGAFNTNLGRKGNGQGAHEEYDLNVRLKEAGGRIWWLPNAAIRHHMPAHRLRVALLARKEMAEGSTSALLRLQNHHGANKTFYAISRIVVGPFHCLANLLWSFLTLPVDHGKLAARAFMRAARIAGFSWQMFLFAIGKRAGDKMR